MTEYGDNDLDEAELAALSELLGTEDVWVDADPKVEAGILRAITGEAGPVERLSPPRPGREDRRHLWLIGAVAVLFLVVGVAVALIVGGDDDTVHVALVGTELAPGAAAEAELDETPQGLRILLDVVGLPPAEPGTYYQAWVRTDTEGISAGTFHLRGGDGSIELWAGVSFSDYPIITVTLQREGAGPESSGQVVLRGTVG